MNNNYTIEPRRGVWHDFFCGNKGKIGENGKRKI